MLGRLIYVIMHGMEINGTISAGQLAWRLEAMWPHAHQRAQPWRSIALVMVTSERVKNKHLQ